MSAVVKRRASGLLRGLLSGPLLVCALAALPGMACSDGAPSPSPSPAPRFEIAERGRISIERAALPAEGDVVLELTLNDDGEASAREARVVSQDGRRIDTRIERVDGRPSAFRLVIDAAFLRPGGYLIQVDAIESHPLDLRRYVVVVTD